MDNKSRKTPTSAPSQLTQPLPQHTNRPRHSTNMAAAALVGRWKTVEQKNELEYAEAIGKQYFEYL